VIEVLDTLVTVGAVLVGFVFGRRERNLKKPIVYRCECSHSLALHNDGTGKAKSTSCNKGSCGCRQYIGTRPVEWTEGVTE
jgi:hypothetical protein